MNKPVAQQSSGSAKNMFASIVIVVALVVACLVFFLIMGSPSNFEDNNTANHPLPGNYLGIIYKGGVIVPLLMTLLILVFTFSIERYMTIKKAAGKTSAYSFLTKIRTLLSSSNVAAVEQECDRQQGSLGNVVKSAMVKYREVEGEQQMDKDQKIVAIQKQIEEATELEMPMLQKNLVFLSTIATVATLIALLGTVLGMIKAFASLAQAGSPDSIGLATGISEALINTAFGIGTSALAVISYNYFTTMIDSLTYAIDEAGFSIINTFSATHK
ncbi:MAG: MotA/TolQ/ExbB proton channel family protein [Bacteroidia bacterium]